jgi:hypothetical protein
MAWYEATAKEYPIISEVYPNLSSGSDWVNSIHSGLAWGCRIFKFFDFLVDMGSFNIQMNKKEKKIKFSKSIVQKNNFLNPNFENKIQFFSFGNF